MLSHPVWVVEMERAVGAMRRHSVSRAEGLLWVVVVAALVVDIGLTWYALSMQFRELNPVARHAYNSIGVFGLVSLKLLAVGVGLLCRRATPVEYTIIIPAALAMPWVIASTMNTVLLIVVL